MILYLIMKRQVRKRIRKTLNKRKAGILPRRRSSGMDLPRLKRNTKKKSKKSLRRKKSQHQHRENDTNPQDQVR